MDSPSGELTELQGGARGTLSADLETQADGPSLDQGTLWGCQGNICLWESDRSRFKFMCRLCDSGQVT